jgi:putative membrane-bound dehydrogenase-like protein
MSSHVAFAARVVAVVLLAFVVSRAQDRPSNSSRALTVPPGFEIEQVAGPPLVDRPIVAAFDEAGRLYVADSSGSNAPVKTQLTERPHRIVRLEDTNGDGRFDRSGVFADQMMLPEGTMWLDGSLYVAAPPSIWKLTDTDNDGIAEQREEWFNGVTLTGCANDLHGPYPGPDGWIYWTKGGFAEQRYPQTGTSTIVTRAAHVFRRRPGDPTIEIVMSGGMDNPVDVAFTPAGERFVTSTFVEHPQAGRRDGFFHAIYGGVYGKPQAAIDGHKRTGELMPIMCQLGPAVPAGLTRYASRAFGTDFRDSFFVAMFNLRKVTRHTLVPSGATFTTRDTDFVVSTDRDFHPTDVVEDADGSLLVIDTGPWYKLCCPTSQIAKPDLPGGIYRVRRTGAHRIDDPRGHRLAWTTMTATALAGYLDDPRPVVVERAMAQLARLRASAVDVLARTVNGRRSAEMRRNAVWTLTRIEDAGARAAVRAALADADDSVRQAAAHAAGLRRDRDARPALVTALTSGRPAVQRAVAEALGRLDDAAAVPALLAAAARPVDRVLEHSLTYALIEIGDARATGAGLTAAAVGTRRAALVALDQMDGGGLTPGSVLPLLDSPDPMLKATAWWIALGHTDWGGDLAGYFRTRLGAPVPAGAMRDDLEQKLARLAGHAAVQQVLADAVASGSTDAQLVALGAMAIAGSPATPVAQRLKTMPPVWATPLSRALSAADADIVRRAVAVARVVSAVDADRAEVDAALVRVAGASAHANELRLAALAARRAAAPLDADLFAFVRAALTNAAAVSDRSLAAMVVERTGLDRTQLLSLADVLASVRPLDLTRVLTAFDRSTDEAVGLAVVRALERSTLRAVVSAEFLRARLSKYPAPVQSAADAWLASATGDDTPQAARLADLVGNLGTGDIARGQTVFNSDKAACLSCHAIGAIGGRIGPDLTRIGQVRADRDLVEAIVFPSASFARGYEPVQVRTRSSVEHAGMLRSETPEAVILGTVDGGETRIPRSEIASLDPGVISPMPQGYDALLSRQELSDLVAFLRAAR